MTSRVWTHLAIGAVGLSALNLWGSTRPIRVSRGEVMWSWLSRDLKDPNHPLKAQYDAAIAKHEYFHVDESKYEQESDVGQHLTAIAQRKVFKEVHGSLPKHTNWYWKRFWVLAPWRDVISWPLWAEREASREVTKEEPMILWGYQLKGPLYVLEGNNRTGTWNPYIRRSWWPRFETVYLGLAHSEPVSDCILCRIGEVSPAPRLDLEKKHR